MQRHKICNTYAFKGERHMKTSSVVLLATATSLGIACASHPPPTDHMASALAAVRGAQVAVAQAGQVPEAALHLKLAEEQVAQARQMIDRGDNQRADYMTLRAFNDAELALALAREHQARAAADEAAKRGGRSATTEPTQPSAGQDDAAPQSSMPHAEQGSRN
jgi:hypothetical protein